MSAVAVYVFDENVAGVGLWAETVIANVYPSITDCKTVDVIRIPSVGVLWEIL